jgi:predicted acylesterase/phospholipase RssA
VPYIDGSLSSYFGIREAIRLKCKQIIIVNVRAFDRFVYEKNNLAEYSDHISALLVNQLVKDEIEIGKKLGAKIIEIRTKVGNIHFTDFRFTEELIEAGEEAAKEVLGRIR